MNVEVEDVGACRKKIRVEWPAEQVQSDYKEALAEYCKSARIKGFRPGKAPENVVAKRHAKDIRGTIRDRLVPKGYHEAVKEKGLKVLQVVDMEEPDVATDAPMTFSVTVEVAPEFDVPDYRGIPLTREKEAVDEAKIDETIQSVLDQFASFDEVTDRPVQRGDLVLVDYEGVCEGQGIDEISEETKGLGKREDFWVRADENAFLPEFAEGLVGAAVGEKKQIMVDFPDDFSVSELAGKKGTYFVDVKGIREKKMPEMDAAFFERLGIEDEATLRARIREDLEKSAEQRMNASLRRGVIDHVVNSVEMELPPGALSRQTQQIIQEVIRENSSRGIKEETLMEKREEIVEMAGRNAEHRVKAQFVLEQIAEKEGIDATPQQLREHIDQMASGYGMSPGELREKLKERDAMDTVESELRRSMAVDFLLAQAVVTDK